MLDVSNLNENGSVSASSYMAYPANKPFVNTKWVKPNTKLSKAFPESNRDLILSTLENMQQKIKKLELEAMSSVNANEPKMVYQPALSSNVPVTDTGLYSAYPVELRRLHTSDDSESKYDGLGSQKTGLNESYRRNSLENSVDMRRSVNQLYTSTISQPTSYLPVPNNNEQAKKGAVATEAESLLKSNSQKIDLIDQKSSNTERRVFELEKKLEQMRKLLREDDQRIEQDNNEPIMIASHQLNQSCSSYESSLHHHVTRRRSSQLNQPDLDQSDLSEMKIVNPMSRNIFPPSMAPNHQSDAVNSEELSINEEHTRKKKATKMSKKNRQVQTEDEFTSQYRSNGANRSRSLDTFNHQRTPTTGSTTNSSGKKLYSPNHYRLNIPFVVGKSTSPSHNLGANIQNVISLLKQHNPKLCGSVHNAHESCHDCSSSLNSNKDSHSIYTRNDLSTNDFNIRRVHSNDDQEISIDIEPSEASQMDLNEYIQILYDEYTKIVLEHNDLTRKMSECTDLNMRQAYEQESERLKKKISSKARQLKKYKAIQDYTQRLNSNGENRETVVHVNKRPKNKSKKKKNSRKQQLLNENSPNNSYDVDDHHHHHGKVNGSSSHYNTLKLFKDIKNLKAKIEKDEMLL